MNVRLLFLVFALLLSIAKPASALTCSATVSDINFGMVSVRAGEVNQTSGTVQIDCTNALVSAVGVCLSFGAGSGGAESGLSPRYMQRGDGSVLAYDLSATSGGAALTDIYVVVPVVLGAGASSFNIFGNITSNSVSVGTGSYSSTFTDPTDISMQYDVLACGLLGSTGSVSNFNVSADVVSSCEVDSATLGFGQISSQISSPADAETTINVRCTDQTSYSVRLGLGTGAGVTDPVYRKMTSVGNTIEYGLYQDSARTTPWGDQVTNDVPALGSGATQSFPVYGRIHAGQTAPVGSYSDNVVITVTY